MASKSKKVEFQQPARINCEDCRHFNGNAYMYRFGCAKGHEAQESWSFKRDACDDNSPLRRDEIILKRFDSLFGTAPKNLKNKKTAIRRTASSLRSALTEFEKVLDSDQIAALKGAANAFDRLGDDVERAAELAKQVQAERDAKYQRDRDARLDAIAADYFGIAGDQKVLEIAKDMEAFCDQDGRAWFEAEKGSKDAWVPMQSYSLSPFIRGYLEKPSASSMQALKRKFAEYVEELRSSYNPALTAKMPDFEKYRIWRAEKLELQRMADANPTIVILKKT